MVFYRIVAGLMLLLTLVIAQAAPHLHRVRPDQNITFIVSDGYGKPIPEAEVRLAGPIGAGGVAQLTPVVKSANKDGRVVFNIGKAGTYHLTSSHDRYFPYTGDVIIPDAGDLAFQIVLKPSLARIVVRVVDDETGRAIVGATVKVTRADKMVSDSLSTDLTGVAYLILNQNEATQGGVDYVVTASASEYETASDDVTADLSASKDADITISLHKNKGAFVVHVTLLEDGSGQPILYGRVVLDNGAGDFESGYTDGAGEATLYVHARKVYRLTVTTKYHDPVSDSIDFSSRSGPTSVARTYRVATNELAHDMRRVLVVRVRSRDKSGVYRPVSDAALIGAGQSSGATDANGIGVFYHKVAPGESIHIVATKAGFKTAATDIIVRANGKMLDMDQLMHDLGRGDTDVEAYQRQGVFAIDSATLELNPDNVSNLTGDVIPLKGRVKVDEREDVTVSLLYTNTLRGSDSSDLTSQVMVHEKVELFGPDGHLISSNLGSRTLTSQSNSRRNFAIVAHEPGTYTLKSTVTGDGLTPWTDEASFNVRGAATTGESSGTTPGVTGYFKLTKKVVGHAADPEKTSSGVWSGSVSESSFTVSFQANSADDHGTLTANWSVPPGNIKPGDVIELTVATSADIGGKDHGNYSLEAYWNGTGDITRITGDHAFAGTSQSGKIYSSGNEKYQFKAGAGGSFTLYSSENQAWGTGGVWRPCEYTYTFVTGDAPKDDKAKATLSVGG